MRKKNTYWVIAGSAALAMVATVMMSSQVDQPVPEASTSPQTPMTVPDKEDAPLENVAATEVVEDEVSAYRVPPVPYPGENGVFESYGERIRFSRVADCTETQIQTMQGDWLPTHDCGPKRLEVDHPYGFYTIEQLEYAANDMDDPDAAYILAERFATEPWRNRREEAQKYYIKAFLLTTDGEIYERMVADMGIQKGISLMNGEVDAANLAANYTMARVGQKFGVVDNHSVDGYAAEIEKLDEIDLERLNQDADDIYETLLAAKGGM